MGDRAVASKRVFPAWVKAVVAVTAASLVLLAISWGGGGDKPPPGPQVADPPVPPLSAADIDEHFAAGASLADTDPAGNPLFSVSHVEPGSDLDKAEAEELFSSKEMVSARAAASLAMSGVFMAMVDPGSDQSEILASQGETMAGPEGEPLPGLADYLPSAEQRSRISSVRYSSVHMPMGHVVGTEGFEPVVSGVMVIDGTLRYDGEPKGFHFYADFNTAQDGELLWLGNMRLELDGVPLRPGVLD